MYRLIIFSLIILSCNGKNEGSKLSSQELKSTSSNVVDIEDSLPKWAKLILNKENVKTENLFKKNGQISFLRIDINGDNKMEVALLDKYMGIILLFSNNTILYLKDLKDYEGFGFKWEEIVTSPNNNEWAISKWEVEYGAELINYFKEIEVKEKVAGQIINMVYNDEGNLSIYYDGNIYKIVFYD